VENRKGAILPPLSGLYAGMPYRPG